MNIRRGLHRILLFFTILIFLVFFGPFIYADWKNYSEQINHINFICHFKKSKVLIESKDKPQSDPNNYRYLEALDEGLSDSEIIEYLYEECGPSSIDEIEKIAKIATFKRHGKIVIGHLFEPLLLASLFYLLGCFIYFAMRWIILGFRQN